MATTNYHFYTVETDPIRPFQIKVKYHKGQSAAMVALTTNKRVQAMTTCKATAEAIAKRMTATMMGVI